MDFYSLKNNLKEIFIPHIFSLMDVGHLIYSMYVWYQEWKIKKSIIVKHYFLFSFHKSHHITLHVILLVIFHETSYFFNWKSRFNL
jgi:hypothetical protein